ncbi:MAG: hypothetical protein AAGI15_04700 [Pseudomonadota bacterium]
MLRSATFLLVLLAALGGCASAPAPAPEFAWYHPAGGEYLFAYDSQACQEEATARGQADSLDPTSPYFSCMYQLGYLLVDEQGLRSAPTLASRPVGQPLSQQ